MGSAPDDALASAGRLLSPAALWSYAAFGVVAATGALANLTIAAFLGQEGLGVFAQLYAIFVVASQLASLGVHDSAQRHVALARGEGEDDRALVDGALLAVLGPGAAVALATAIAAQPIGALVGSDSVGEGVLALAPGILPMALNKTCLGVLVGRGELRPVALGQMLRAGAIAVGLGAVIVLDLPLGALGGAFTLAEVVLLVVALAWARPRGRPRAASDWVRRHLRFGARGLVHAVLLEAHVRVDVVMLALFVEDEVVGVYAFAALFAEGLYQLGGVLRAVVYARVVGALARRERDELWRLVRQVSVRSMAVTGLVGVVVVLAFPAFRALTSPAFVAEGRPILVVLASAMVLYAAVAPFDQVLLQSGRAGLQSAWMLGAVTLNVALDALAIPRLGALGAALATAAAFTVSSLALVAIYARLGGSRAPEQG